MGTDRTAVSRIPVAAAMAALTLIGAAALWGQEGDDWKIRWWNEQRKGANMQNEKPRSEYWQAAGKLGLAYVRIAPNAFPAERRDFLIGNADAYEGIIEADFALLERELDEAERNGVKVVVTMFSLPGARWSQKNGDVRDGRLWREERYRSQATAFWRDLASRLKGHPAVVAYNPLNEPCPDREYGFELGDTGFEKWYAGIRGTVADVNEFNRRMVAAIRETDAETPIMLDGWFYAHPKGFAYDEPIGDPRILYAFHNPGPWQLCTFKANKGKYSYPDRVPEKWNGRGRKWNRDRLAREFAEVERWAAAHGVDRRRIVASEFLIDRRVAGAAAYLADCIALYNARGWHWSFYAFRQDGAWGGLDYELGTDERMGSGYWEAVERGEDPEPLKKRGPNPLWDVIAREFKK